MTTFELNNDKSAQFQPCLCFKHTLRGDNALVTLEVVAMGADNHLSSVPELCFLFHKKTEHFPDQKCVYIYACEIMIVSCICAKYTLKHIKK